MLHFARLKCKFQFRISCCLWENIFFFSRDRGFTNTTYPPVEPPFEFYTPREVTVYYGETIFVYGVSSVLHFFGFLSAMYVFRIADNEQLQNLVERVFILHNVPNKLIYNLWMQIAYGFVWSIMMSMYLIVMEDDNIDAAKIVWLGKPTPHTQIVAKILLIAVTFVQDLIQMIVLTSYSLQCYLLRRYVYVLKGKLLQNTIDSLDWMRVCDCWNSCDWNHFYSIGVFLFVPGNGWVPEIVVASQYKNRNSSVSVHNFKYFVYIFGHYLFHSDLWSIYQQQSCYHGVSEYISVAHFGSLPLFSGKLIGWS